MLRESKIPRDRKRRIHPIYIQYKKTHQYPKYSIYRCVYTSQEHKKVPLAGQKILTYPHSGSCYLLLLPEHKRACLPRRAIMCNLNQKQIVSVAEDRR